MKFELMLMEAEEKGRAEERAKSEAKLAEAIAKEKAESEVKLAEVKAESEAKLAEEKTKGEAKLAENYASLVKDGILTLPDAIKRSELSEEDFKKYLEP